MLFRHMHFFTYTKKKKSFKKKKKKTFIEKNSHVQN